MPKLVIPFNAVALNVPLKIPPLMIPGTYKLLIVPLNALKLAAVTLPDTVKFVSVPSVVMFGWFAVVSVTLIVLALMLLATLKFCKPFRLVMFAVTPLNTSAVTVPATVILFA